MAFALGLGLLADVLGIYSFIDSQIPDSNTAGATFRIQAGLDGYKNAHDPQGGLTQIKLYNVLGDFIGSGGGINYIGPGDYADVTVEQDVRNQALTAEFYASDNAICIATITTTLHDDTKYAWVGDWGKICHAKWYYSGVAVESGKLTRCTWIDQNHDFNLTAAVIGIYFPAFATQEIPDTDGTELCGQVQGLRAWNQEGGSELLWDINHGSEKLRSRVTLPGKQAGDDRLVVSADPNHNATELCSAGESYGPDFVSLAERLYCDMGTRELLPLCGSGLTDNCFDLEAARAGVPSGRISAIATKPRSEILEW
ncbi:hypothetical protein DL769_009790 [Monosporascus sp. CRB-8-3]|nr:hypothetical protein DL769_009790 [Monosporascus sp. CRB-8-3]